MGYIYLTRNKINDKIYIGKTVKNSAKSRYYLGSGKYIKRAIEKHGKDNLQETCLRR